MTLDDFAAVNRAALGNISNLLQAWFPRGVINGAEFCIGSAAGEAGQSMRIHLTGHKAGYWSDFDSGGDAAGTDIISLYAFIHSLPQGRACAALASELGVRLSEATHGKATPLTARPARHSPAHAQAGGGVEGKKLAKKSPWTPVVPAPDDAGPYPRAHLVRGKPEAFWEYRRYAADGTSALLGVVYRFKTSNGGKEVLPCVFAENLGKREWHWMQFPEPRPLYSVCRPHADRPAVVFEGEKKVKAASAVLMDAFDCYAWPGGCNAVSKANWQELAGRDVILWPDADAKAYKEGHARAGELMPLEQQPGSKAMANVRDILLGLGCRVAMVALPDPGELDDGWDVADLIQAGGGMADVMAWIQPALDQLTGPPTASAPDVQASASVPPVPPASFPLPLPGSADTDQPAGAKRVDKRQLRQMLIPTANGGVKGCRENVYLVMEHDPRLSGVVGLNLFDDLQYKRRAPPWPGELGEWQESDDFQLGLYLAQNHGLVIASIADIERGVAQAARSHSYNPVTEYILDCASRWDEQPRVESAFSHYWGAQDSEYMRLVSIMFFTGLVMRAFKPGVKHDHAPVFEGPQGHYKSSALRVLGGSWFADTPFRMGEKDGFLSIQGVLLYEVAELEQFNRSELTAVKAFMSSEVDRYREPYGRRMRNRPRKTAFAATTNEDQYFKDPTGNRRFWPVACGTQINIEGLKADRDMLFAEAYWKLQGGVRWWPTKEEERRLIFPEQDDRVIQDMWMEPIRHYLDGVDSAGKPTLSLPKNRVTTYDVFVNGLKGDIAKATSSKSEQTRIGTCLKKLGWLHKRSTKKGDRSYYYVRPGTEEGCGDVEPE